MCKRESGRLISVREVQSLAKFVPTYVTLLGIWSDWSDEQPWNILKPAKSIGRVGYFGGLKVTDWSDTHPLKAESPIDTPAGNSTDFSWDPWKHPVPIFKTESGICISNL